MLVRSKTYPRLLQRCHDSRVRDWAENASQCLGVILLKSSPAHQCENSCHIFLCLAWQVHESITEEELAQAKTHDAEVSLPFACFEEGGNRRALIESD